MQTENAQDGSQGEIRVYEKNETIFSENDLPDGVYIVKEGLVQIFHISENNEELELGRIGIRGMFGEMGLIDHQRRSASARALGPTRCVFISRAEFHKHLATLPPWVAILIKSFVHRLRESNRILYQVLEENQTQVDKESDLVLHKGSEASDSIESASVEETSGSVTQVLRHLGHEE